METSFEVLIRVCMRRSQSVSQSVSQFVCLSVCLYTAVSVQLGLVWPQRLQTRTNKPALHART